MAALKEPQGVSFDEMNHVYTYRALTPTPGVKSNVMPLVEYTTKTLSGVTALLGRQLFKDKYDGISKGIMEKAAERGNLIHRQIEMFETFGGDNLAPEVDAYKAMKEKNKYETLATEWLVSDREHVASSIDVIFEKGKKLILCDIKTTSKLDMEYLSWQLSIYKYLLLLDNPKAKIEKLVACWLPREQYGRPKMVDVPEKPREWVKDLIECDARGEQWVNPEAPVVADESALVVPQEITSAIAELLRVEKVAKDMKERLKELMEENGIKKWECDAFVATYTPAGVTSKFDSTAFKKDYPDLYDEYVRECERKSSIRTTLR